ncbi:hypothetical protein [uncultured Paracoccus sp.]|uniref:hypothetical protein n=1 Tax=uncultured Paracoccus sp. TaxID=189685 RepID=UPI0025E703A5|nr:hypothetical protein [uncultured Paracoccus sp.]
MTAAKMTAAQLRAAGIADDRPQRKPRVQRELPYHMQVVNTLRHVLPGARINHPPNELAMSGPTARNLIVKARRMGMLKGFPDLTVLLPDGRTLYFEVKPPADAALGRRAGRESTEQKELREWAQSAGHLWAVVQGAPDVIDALQQWGVAMRGRIT